MDPIQVRKQGTSGDKLDELERAKEEKVALLKANIARLTAELMGNPSLKNMLKRRVGLEDMGQEDLIQPVHWID